VKRRLEKKGNAEVIADPQGRDVDIIRPERQASPFISFRYSYKEVSSDGEKTHIRYHLFWIRFLCSCRPDTKIRTGKLPSMSNLRRSQVFPSRFFSFGKVHGDAQQIQPLLHQKHLLILELSSKIARLV